MCSYYGIRRVKDTAMKNINITVICLLMLAFFGSCGKIEKPTSEAGLILEGRHELRRFKVTTKEGYRWSASYFIIAGSASGGTYSNTNATFSWKTNTGEYATSEIRLSKIRIRIDSTVTTPYIEFNWDSSNSNNLEYLVCQKVNYVVITCKEEDYPVRLNIDQL